MSRSASDSSPSRSSDSRRAKRRRPRDRDRHKSRHATARQKRRSPHGHGAKARRIDTVAVGPQVVQGAWSAYALQMSPWHYAGASHAGFVPSSWGVAVPSAYGAMTNGYARDFAQHRPDAYHAFEQTAVRSNGVGLQVGLTKRMCLDKHVPDFLACLSCWLRRNIGDPMQRLWRLQCLDLSHNLLVDDSILQLMASLRHGSVRLQQLLLAGNRITATGLGAITEYIWDTPEALCEMDLSGNEISVAREVNGDDPVSVLLRCFYNHSAYPRRKPRSGWVVGQREDFDLDPLILRIGGNLLEDPVRLLGQICEKGGRERVCLRPDAEVYRACRDEFLSLYLPDFTRQRKSGEVLRDDQASITSAACETSEEELAAPDLDDLEEDLVQKAIAQQILRLGCDGFLASDTGDALRWTIAGLALALLQAPTRKTGRIILELESFVGNGHGRPLLEWLMEHIRTLRC